MRNEESLSVKSALSAVQSFFSCLGAGLESPSGRLTTPPYRAYRGDVNNPAILAALALCLCTATGWAADLRGARLFKSGPIQITANGSSVWCVNSDNDSVTRINTSTDVATEFVLPPVTAKHLPRGLSVKEDGSEVWVTCHDSDRVYVLSGVDGSVLAQIDLPWGSGPFSIAIAPDQQKALVTLHRGEGLAVLDVPGPPGDAAFEKLFWAPMGVAGPKMGRPLG